MKNTMTWHHHYLLLICHLPFDLVGSVLRQGVHAPKAIHLATVASRDPMLLDPRRYCPARNDPDLAKRAVAKACDSGGRP